MYAKVMVDVAHSNVDRLFTYEVPNDLAVTAGQRVLIPFGGNNRSIEGFVLELSENAPDNIGTIKRIVRAMEPYPALTAEQIELAKWISKSYHCLLVEALRLMIPAQLRGGRVKEKTERIVRINADIDPHQALDSLKNSSGSSADVNGWSDTTRVPQESNLRRTSLMKSGSISETVLANSSTTGGRHSIMASTALSSSPG